MSGYQVFEYSLDELLRLFKEHAGSSEDYVTGKFHSIYFRDYFSALKARTIVVEEHYVDRDYLEDFIGYYGRCFSPPDRYCVRIHFFRSSFVAEDLDSFLANQSDRKSFLRSKLNSKQYLGFVVVKPLPQTFIGRTCLRTYPTASTGRHFPALRDYDVNLFGVPLTVRSLAYQEQDTEVARCATAALWSTFQGTAKRFGHPVPTPIEITKHAMSIHGNQSRTLPAKDGLTLEQMGDAIRKMNLEPHFSEVPKREYLQAEAYAYLRAGIPVVMVASLVDTQDKLKKRRDRGKWYGCHALVLTGYHMSNQSVLTFGDTSMYWRATRVDKFYAHDDQVGPFSRLVLSGNGSFYEWEDEHRRSMRTYFMESSWSGESEELGSVLVVPETIIVPLYPKMRITFREALAGMKEFASLLGNLGMFGYVSLPGVLEWDLYLTTGSELKSELFEGQMISGSYAQEILTQSMPRFLWRAIAYQNDAPVLELLFDATAILQGNFFFRAIEHDPNLLRVLRNPNAVGFADDGITLAMLEWFRDN